MNEQQHSSLSEWLRELNRLDERLNERSDSERKVSVRELYERAWSEQVRARFTRVVSARKWEFLKPIAVEVQATARNRALAELAAEAIRELAAAPESYKNLVRAAALLQVLHSGMLEEFLSKCGERNWHI